MIDFWDVAQCSLVENDQRFRGDCYLGTTSSHPHNCKKYGKHMEAMQAYEINFEVRNKLRDENVTKLQE
jgi:hypothetical protein